MTQAGFYQPKRTSPTAFTLVVVLHGAAIAALVLTKMEYKVKDPGPGPVVIDVPLQREPDPIPPEPIEAAKPTQIDMIKTVVPLPPPPRPPEDLTFTRTEHMATKAEPLPPEAKPEPPPPPKAEPVRRDAQVDPRSELKPPYPARQRELGNEGSVTVRITIGPDGRVRDAQKVRATNDDFYQATIRHALRHWRFKPATIDGRPIESSKVMTLHFSLEGDA